MDSCGRSTDGCVDRPSHAGDDINWGQGGKTEQFDRASIVESFATGPSFITRNLRGRTSDERVEL